MIVNGKEYDYQDITVASLLNELQIHEKMIVVELNNVIVGQKQYDEQVLKKDDKIEIVSFVGGG